MHQACENALVNEGKLDAGGSLLLKMLMLTLNVDVDSNPEAFILSNKNTTGLLIGKSICQHSVKPLHCSVGASRLNLKARNVFHPGV